MIKVYNVGHLVAFQESDGTNNQLCHLCNDHIETTELKKQPGMCEDCLIEETAFAVDEGLI